MPVDRFHSGFDTVAYLHLHRYLAAVLHASGDLPFSEPIAGHMGHEMVLRDGRKMSKHLGNTVSPSGVIRKHGADTLRVAMLWAAGPHTAVDWRPQLLSRAESLLGSFHRLYSLAACAGVTPGPPATPSKNVRALQRRAKRSLAVIARFVDEYRPNAGIEELAGLLRHTEAFALRRLQSSRLLPGDAGLLREILEAECVALALFAPHLAEELWHRMGNSGYVVQQRWPQMEEVAGATALAAAQGW
jgi:leucyl-tRNA synthetase